MKLSDWLPRYRPLPIPTKYIWWVLPSMLLIITFQVSEIEAGKIYFSMYRTSLLTIYYGTWWLLIPFIYGYFFLFESDWRKIPHILGSICLVFIFLILHLLLSNFLLSIMQVYLFDRPESHLSQLQGIWPALLFNRLLTLTVIVFLLKVIDNFKQLQSTRLKLSEAESRLRQSELEQLRAQLNPHFLFNSLHTITSIIGYDDQQARSLTMHLGEMLRTNLEKEQRPFQTLREEMDFIESYLTIQQERFKDWVDINIRTDPQIMNARIPGLLLQPLIENAFIHGVEGFTEKGSLAIEVGSSDDMLNILIKNTVNPFYQSKPSTGIGIANVRHRLDLLYEGKACFDVRHEQDYFIVTLQIPIT